MQIYDEVKKIIDPVYMVGGCVRDELLGRTPKDYDFATPYTPEEIESAIRRAGRKPYLIGKRFGTLGVKINGTLVEITTFRAEKYEKGNRKPKVEFVKDITADLSRRDFRINAIAKREGRYIDPFGGRLDIIERKIKCVGTPRERFKEDPLRMLRASRFASQLEFEVDEFLTNTVEKMNHYILNISKERWVMEMDTLLTTDKPSIGLEFLAKTKLLNFMFPELALQVGYDQNSLYHSLSLWEHTKKVVDLTPNDIILRWSALLHDIGKPFVRRDRKDRSNYVKHDLLGKDLVIKTALYLKWSNDRKEQVSELVLNHLLDGSPLKDADNKAKGNN